ncbi:hypothetical protein Droror1_Dr00004003 [Drosera rotundifolia]
MSTPLDPITEQVIMPMVRIGELKDSLALYYSSMNEPEVTVWRMAEYGVVRSWFKLSDVKISYCRSREIDLVVAIDKEIELLLSDKDVTDVLHSESERIPTSIRSRVLSYLSCGRDVYTSMESLVLYDRSGALTAASPFCWQVF